MNKIIIVMLVTLFIGCSKETELSRTIFIEDADSPGLPVYSELGYNTFGAYYDRLPFISTNTFVPAKYFVREGVGSFLLEGERKENRYVAGNQLMVRFDLPEVTPDNFTGLITLHLKTFDLTDDDVTVYVNIDGVEHSAEILNGEIAFFRAQSLKVDGELMQVILSGRFQFQAVVDSHPVTIKDGRFDVGISPSNFYSY